MPAICTKGQVFTTDGWRKPDGLCDSAWQTLSPFVMTLAHGGTNIYDGWMKNPASAMISCNDGFPPRELSDRNIREIKTLCDPPF